MCMVLQEKYYAEKLEIKRGDDAGRRRVVDAFVEGLHWVLEYYYRCAALDPARSEHMPSAALAARPHMTVSFTVVARRQSTVGQSHCRGVASWTWYYPFHYAPITSDMTDIASTKVGSASGGGRLHRSYASTPPQQQFGASVSVCSGLCDHIVVRSVVRRLPLPRAHPSCPSSSCWRCCRLLPAACSRSPSRCVSCTPAGCVASLRY